MESYIIEELNQPVNISIGLTDRSYRSNYHIHADSYEIYLFLGNNVKYYIDEKVYDLNPFDFFIISPFTVHKAFIKDEFMFERIVIHISVKELLEISTPQTNFVRYFNDYSGKRFHISEDKYDYINELKEKLLDSVTDTERFGNDILKKSYLSLLFVQLLQIAQTTENILCEPLPALLLDVMEYINANYTEEISIDSIAGYFNVSRSSLCHQFRSHYNTSLWNYIVGKRLLYAQKLLSENKSVQEVCFQSGFTDYAHFIKTFSKNFGVSPGKYIQAFKSKN